MHVVWYTVQQHCMCIEIDCYEGLRVLDVLGSRRGRERKGVIRENLRQAAAAFVS